MQKNSTFLRNDPHVLFSWILFLSWLVFPISLGLFTFEQSIYGIATELLGVPAFIDGSVTFIGWILHVISGFLLTLLLIKIIDEIDARF